MVVSGNPNLGSSQQALELAQLPPLMELSAGAPEVVIGLIDGPVQVDHPSLAGARIRAATSTSTCAAYGSSACRHGTFVAGILSAGRGSSAPAICPGCTLLTRTIFSEDENLIGQPPVARPQELADAITDCVMGGARVLNISAALAHATSTRVRPVHDALAHAARREVIVVVAAGNQATISSSVITRHPWVIPVAACGPSGHPLALSNLGRRIGARGLSAPGEAISSLDSTGGEQTLEGTSAATAFVTGAIALMWSLLPRARGRQLKYAIAGAPRKRPSLVPPVLNATAAYARLRTSLTRNAA